ILWIELADRLERDRLQRPRLERRVVVRRILDVDLHAVAECADVLVERRLEPAIAEPAAVEPARRERAHRRDELARVDVRRAEELERPRRPAALRQRRALD